MSMCALFNLACVYVITQKLRTRAPAIFWGLDEVMVEKQAVEGFRSNLEGLAERKYRYE